MRRYLRLTLSSVCLVLAPLAAQAQAVHCLADWSEAAPIVRRENLVPVDRLVELARGRLIGDVVRTQLCEEKGHFVYKILLREHGQIRTHTIDARRPFGK